jgi:nucleotide-binding universal stress UspA family protein
MAFHHILVPIDFDETSNRAVKTAMDLANAITASITLLHTIEIRQYAYANFGAALPPPDLLSALEVAARRSIDQTLEGVRARVPSAKAIVTTGVPWRQILAAIDELQADLVVMGTHGRQGLGRALLGSVAEKIVRSSPVAVMTVPRPR